MTCKGYESHILSSIPKLNNNTIITIIISFVIITIMLIYNYRSPFISMSQLVTNPLVSFKTMTLELGYSVTTCNRLGKCDLYICMV